MKRRNSYLAGLLLLVCSAIPVKAEWPPQQVIDTVYEGIQEIHSYQGTPRLIYNVEEGTVGGCGPISSTHYCTADHTIYITVRDINMAYEHGDAALAYIIAHEYAHGMQTAFGFQPGVTPISELQADCLAGVYLGMIPNITFDEQDMREILSLAYRLGDFAWDSEEHHGTPEQRYQAVVIGMQGALEGRGFDTCKL